MAQKYGTWISSSETHENAVEPEIFEQFQESGFGLSDWLHSSHKNCDHWDQHTQISGTARGLKLPNCYGICTMEVGFKSHLESTGCFFWGSFSFESKLDK